MKRIGSNTPLFRSSAEKEDVAALLGGAVTISKPVIVVEEEASSFIFTETKNQQTVRPAVHMDAMAFGMGCCCLQITFQATDIDESRFIYDQLAVMAPM
jgi:Glutamate-cysteine ligase